MSAMLFELDPVPVREVISFTAYGRPRPAGSKKFVGFIDHGPKKGRPLLVDDSGHKGRMWRRTVQRAAREVYNGRPLEWPMRMRVDFYFRRPKLHYVGNNRGGRLKDSAPSEHVTKPDTTKLLRSIEDALTGIVYVDDSAIVSQLASKHYGPKFKVDVAIELLERRTIV
jgi:Holliday junction resolvase RusA-like endonuclease